MREKRGSAHDFLERTRLPFLIVILVPVVFIGYALWSWYAPAQPASQPAAPVAPANTPPPPAVITIPDGSSFPTSVTQGELVPFSFSIQNPSSQSTTYQYKVSVRWSSGENDVIDENVLPLPAGASQTVDEELKFELATETADVIVELPQTGQSRSFTLPR